MSQRSQRKGGPTPRPCPNPLFEQWLQEWKEDAAQKNSKMQFVYAKALSSLRKYPLPLARGKDCLILEYFGPSIAKMIDRKMEQEGYSFEDSGNLSGIVDDNEYKKPTTKKKKKKKGDDPNNEEDPNSSQEKPAVKNRSGKAYIPAYRSGAYAILAAIRLKETKPGYRGYMTKTELVPQAQDHCDSSMTRNETGGTYTAWNSMATLVNKGLVLKQGNPTKYLLSPEGRELASKLLQADGHSIPSGSATSTVTSNDMDDDDDDEPSQALNNSALHHRTVLEPGEFEIVLYVDTSETSGRCNHSEVLAELRKNGITFEVFRLSVGDFAWVCRKSNQPAPNSKRLTISRSAEVIIPYVVERKRSDDLAHSIKDGRFHEQKFRLRESGMQPIYLHEVYGKGDHGLADGALKQALANTQMTDGFMVQETIGIKDTCAYLTHMTRYFKSVYENKKISSCTRQEWPTYKERSSGNEIYLMLFSDFNDFGTKSKNWTVTEMFARHLMRLRGLSAERAYAIVQKYPTITALMNAYGNCTSEKEKDTLLANIYYGTGGRTIGPSVSKNIYKLYNSCILMN